MATRARSGAAPFDVVGPVGFDNVTRQSSPATAIKPFYSEKVSGWCIIVSQTCDIAAKDTGAKQAFVMVAPLRPTAAYSRNNASLAKAYQIPYLFPALSPDASETDEIWFADLRLLVPMSKALLLDVEPILGLRDGDALKFAATIAHRFSRPALQEVLSEAVPESIDKHILETKKRSSAYTQTEHVRLVIARDERLSATSVYLMVLGRVEFTAEQEELWREWEPKGQAVLSPHGIDLGPTLFTTPERVPASLYRVAVLSESTAWANCITSKRVDGLVPRTNCCIKLRGDSLGRLHVTCEVAKHIRDRRFYARVRAESDARPHGSSVHVRETSRPCS